MHFLPLTLGCKGLFSSKLLIARLGYSLVFLSLFFSVESAVAENTARVFLDTGQVVDFEQSDDDKRKLGSQKPVIGRLGPDVDPMIQSALKLIGQGQPNKIQERSRGQINDKNQSSTPVRDVIPKLPASATQ